MELIGRRKRRDFSHAEFNGFRALRESANRAAQEVFLCIAPTAGGALVRAQQASRPIEYEQLLSMFDDQVVLDEIRVLLVQKRAAPEPGLAPTVPVLNAFIEAELRDVPMNIPDKPQSAKVIARLNTLFHDALLEHESKGLE